MKANITTQPELEKISLAEVAFKQEMSPLNLTRFTYRLEPPCLELGKNTLKKVIKQGDCWPGRLNKDGH